jgi:hypothetical protein
MAPVLPEDGLTTGVPTMGASGMSGSLTESIQLHDGPVGEDVGDGGDPRRADRVQRICNDR